MKSLQDCLNFLSNLDPFQCEGFVVVDKNYNRMKIKTPKYTMIHNLLNKKKMSMSEFVEIVRTVDEEIYLIRQP